VANEPLGRHVVTENSNANQAGVGGVESVLSWAATCNPGLSGGPLLNGKGQVVGVIAAMVEKAEKVGFAIPINQAADVLTKAGAAVSVVPIPETLRSCCERSNTARLASATCSASEPSRRSNIPFTVPSPRPAAPSPPRWPPRPSGPRASSTPAPPSRTARWAPVPSRSPSRPTQVQDPAKNRSCPKANTRGEV